MITVTFVSSPSPGASSVVAGAASPALGRTVMALDLEDAKPMVIQAREIVWDVVVRERK